MEQDLASYEASSFAVDASRLQFDENGKIKVEDFPAFVHEWWHYIQDISTITGQNGFYLWLRDIIRMTSITCSGEGKTIEIPLPTDQYEEVFSKYRRLYNIFCGEKKDVYIKDAAIVNAPVIVPNGINIDGEKRTFAKCEIPMNDKAHYFGLIALQELNAWYAQKICETYVKGINFNIPADSLPEFPYKLGDLLFDYYKIDCNLQTRFMISTLVLDTLQAPAVFLILLRQLSGKTLEYLKDKDEIIRTLDDVARQHSYPNSAAYQEWGKDYSNWLNDESHQMLRDSLKWYLSMIGLADKLKTDYGKDTLAFSFCCGHDAMNVLYKLLPVPLIKHDGQVLGQAIDGETPFSIAAQHDFENALVIWSHRRIYDLLCSTKRKEMEKNSTCPLYNGGKCPYINRYDTSKGYDCSMSPWMVVKGEKQALCPYSVAAHSMGLWQNDIVINL